MKKKNSYFLLLMILFTAGQVFAQDGEVDSDLGYKRQNYKINSKYSGGEYLIYDCEGQYLACVDEYSNEKCLEKRAESKEKKKEMYACASLKKFETKKKCLEENYRVLIQVAGKRYCYPKNN